MKPICLQCIFAASKYSLSYVYSEIIQNYWKYFEKNFIGHYKSIITNGKLSLIWKAPRKSGRYMIISMDPLKTNFIEGWHRHLMCLMGVSHPGYLQMSQFS